MITLRPPTKPSLGGAFINWSHPLAYRLVGYWLFNERGGTIVRNLAGTSGPGVMTDGVFSRSKEGDDVFCSEFLTSKIAIASVGSVLNVKSFTIMGRCLLTPAGYTPWQRVLCSGSREYSLFIDDASHYGYEINQGAVGFGVSSDTLSLDVWYTLGVTSIGTAGGGGVSLYKDGIKDANTFAHNVDPNDISNLGLLYNPLFDIEHWAGRMSWIGLWNYAMPSSLVARLHADPYSMLIVPSSHWMRTLRRPSAPQAYTEDLNPGVYSYTGVDLQGGIAIPASPGSYTYTGVSLEGAIGEPLVPGTYSYTGFPLTLVAALFDALLPGVYSYTGADTGGALSGTLDPGVYLVQGVDIGLNIGMPLAPGTYLLVGFDLEELIVGGPTAYSDVLEPGSYAYTGVDLGGAVGTPLAPGVYLVVGADTGAEVGMPLTPGVYLVMGMALTSDITSVIGPGLYVVAGADLEGVGTYVDSLEPGVYLVSGVDIGEGGTGPVTPEGGVYIPIWRRRRRP